MSLTIWLRLALPPGEADSLRAEFPDVTFVEGSELSDEQLAAVDAGFFTEMVGDDVIERMPALRWLHSTYGGAGSITRPPVVARGDSGVLFARCACGPVLRVHRCRDLLLGQALP